MLDPVLQRLLVVTANFYPEPFRINEVVEKLAAQNIAVTILTGLPNYPEGRIYAGYENAWKSKDSACGAEVVRLRHLPRGWSRTLSFGSFLASGHLYGMQKLKGRKFDAVFCYGLSPIYVAELALTLGRKHDAPTALWLQDLWPGSLAAAGFHPTRLVTKVLEAWTRRIYRACDLVLCSSPGFLVEVERCGGKSATVAYQPNPAEMPVFNEPTTPLPTSGKFEVVFAGNLGRAISVQTIVDAAEQLAPERDVHIRLVGHGSMADWLQAEILRRSLQNITVEQRVPAEHMPKIYASASALLLTLADNETMDKSLPSKLSTYLASGRPVVAAANGETARIVEESGAGISVAAGDVQALARALVSLRNMPHVERQRMAQAGRVYARAHFNPDLLAETLIERLSAMIVARRKGRAAACAAAR